MAGSDYDDDLLALLDEGAGSSKRKKSSSSKPNKRRRQAGSDDGSASDMDMSQSDSDAPAPSPKASRGRRVKSAAQVDSSDEDDDEDGPEPTADNPYPLEGIFKDVADRKYVMGLPELQREAIIGERRDEATQRELRKQVAQISKQTDKAAAESDEEEEEEEEDDDDEEYSARASRSRKTVGSSKSKSEGIEKLKKSRADKGKKKEKKADSSDDDYEELARRTSRKSRKDDSDSDMDVSSDEDEKDKKGKGKKKAEPVGPEELATITLTRAKLAELCPAPWFGEWIKNAWVRYSVGEDENRQMQYRVCQVIGTAQGKPYRIDNASTEVYLRLKHGKAERIFSMDAVSNTPFTPREYIRLSKTCETDGVAMPTSKEVSKIRDQLAKQNSYTLTEADLSANLKKKPKKLTGAQRKTQLRFERDQAVAANDHDRVTEIDTELANLDKPSGEPRDASAKLNERNRLSNREEVRRAEARSQDERRRQQEALARGVDVKVDASARVKTVPRMNYDSRPQTPNVGTPNGSGHATPVNGGPAAPRPVKGKVDSTVASRVQLDADLLDF